MRHLVSRARLTCALVALATQLTTGLERAPVPASTLPHLHGVEEIRDWFNAGRGHVRLILLLSPT